jgi:hypothetical protein
MRSKKLAGTLTGRQYFLQAESGERRTSDEKFVSTKPRGAEAWSGAEERLWEQIFRASDHYVLKISSLIIAS